MHKLIVFFVIASCMFLYAQETIFTGYADIENDKLAEAFKLARLEAIRRALEYQRITVASTTEVRNYMVTNDLIRVESKNLKIRVIRTYDEKKISNKTVQVII